MTFHVFDTLQKHPLIQVWESTILHNAINSLRILYISSFKFCNILCYVIWDNIYSRLYKQALRALNNKTCCNRKSSYNVFSFVEIFKLTFLTIFSINTLDQKNKNSIEIAFPTKMWRYSTFLAQIEEEVNDREIRVIDIAQHFIHKNTRPEIASKIFSCTF